MIQNSHTVFYILERLTLMLIVFLSLTPHWLWLWRRGRWRQRYLYVIVRLHALHSVCPHVFSFGVFGSKIRISPSLWNAAGLIIMQSPLLCSAAKDTRRTSATYKYRTFGCLSVFCLHVRPSGHRLSVTQCSMFLLLLLTLLQLQHLVLNERHS